MDKAERTLVLQYIQPGLLGLMDGTVSTLAPLFAAAFPVVAFVTVAATMLWWLERR